MIDLAYDPSRILAVLLLQVCYQRSGRLFIQLYGGRNEAGYERYHYDSAVHRYATEDRVGYVARDIDQSTGARMGEDHRRLSHVQCVAHCAGRDVRKIDEHAQAVHLAHDTVTERSQAVVFGRVEGRVCPGERDIVRERHVAHAEVVISA